MHSQGQTQALEEGQPLHFSAGEDFDIGPLAWVLEELRRSVDSAVKNVRRYVMEAQDARGGELLAVDAATLRSANAQLHQAHGALEMVGMPQAARLLHSMESAVQQFVQNPEQCTDSALQVIERCGFALLEYLEAVLAGKRLSAAALFPQYRDMQAVLGNSKVHPADLWEMPSVRAIASGVANVPALQYSAQTRSALEQSVLQVVKTGDPAAATQLRIISQGLASAAASQQPQQQLFWSVAAGFFDALAHQKLALDVYVKRVASRVLMQYGQYAKGDATAPERLLQDMLFFCAQANTPEGVPAVLHEVRTAMGLQQHSAVDYVEARFGRFDPALLIQARKRVASAAESWSALVGGDKSKLKTAQDHFHLVFDSLQRLQTNSGALVQALTRVLQQMQQRGEPPSTAVAMEVATSVLYLQAAFATMELGDARIASHAQVLANRLDRASQGEASQPLAPWMEELYRQASDTQTMGSVVGELRSTLDEAEKVLDQFFRQPTDTSLLAPVVGHLSQMRGVLSVLGLDQASLAMVRMRDVVELLLQGKKSPSEQFKLFDRLGNSLGALGFLIDMLGYQRTMARKLFVYDEERGELRPVMGRTKAPAPTSAPVTDANENGDKRNAGSIPEASPVVPALAPTSLLKQSQALLAEAVPVPVPVEAPMRANVPAIQEAEEAQEVQEEQAFAAPLVVDPAPVRPRPAPEDVPTLSDEVLAEAPAEREAVLPLLEAEQRPSPAIAAVDDDAANADDELRAIFLEEAREVVETGRAALQTLTSHPGNLDAQTTLRRAFHTLKGSSRMVELNVLGEAAWAFEQMVNAWLTQQQAMPQAMQQLCTQALQHFSRWVDAIEAGQDGAWSAQPFIRCADAMRVQGMYLSLDASMVEAVKEALPADSSSSDTCDDAARTLDPLEPTHSASLLGTESALSSALLDLEALPALSEADTAYNAEIELSEFDAGSRVEVVPAAEELDFAEFETALKQASVDTETPEAQTDEMLLDTVHEPLNVLPSEDTVVDFELADFANVEPTPAQEPRVIDATGDEEMVVSEVPEALCQIGPLTIAQPLLTVFLGEAQEWSQQLQSALEDWQVQADAPQPVLAAVWSHGLAGSSATVGFQALSEFARSLEQALLHVQPWEHRVPAETRDTLAAAAGEIRHLLHQFAAGFLRTPAPLLVEQLAAIQAQELELPEEIAQATAMDAEIDLEAFDSAAGMEDVNPNDFGWLTDAELAQEAQETLSAALSPAAAVSQALPGEVPDAHIAVNEAIDVSDILDPDLFPIFEEEAVELLPVLGAAMRQLGNDPGDHSARITVLRALHTLKGSARLAGAMRLGEMAHRLESAMEALDFEHASIADMEPLLHRVDALQANFERLRSAGMQAHAEPVVVQDVAPIDAPAASPAGLGDRPASLPSKVLPAATAPVRSTSQQTVRVRSQLLDRLINEAGEVLIARSRLDARMRVVHNALSDLGGNLERLRQQLRDLEVQAESQMQSRQALSKDAGSEFDPLEFDRFTHVQELTRMMAESVNDVATVQRNLQREVTGAEDDLVAQGRQARELQRDLLRTRMVEFDSVAERLYAVVRIAAKETAKQVKLDLEGGTIEVDRGVLERMTPAFEHLLRNCVGHGIELPEARTEAGKPAQGTITVEVQQDGNDVAVAFRDDGAGLNVARIRKKALEQGLIAADDEVDGAKAAELIFMPGFSTATEVTGLSGRGIGMDVVRSEVQALGGRIETETTQGQGSSFRMVLPLTTAVTQVLMLRVGEFSVGVPANLVETVRRLTLDELEEAYRTGSLQDGDAQLPFYWAGAVWQQSGRSTEEGVGRTRPVLLLRSAAQRIALHVDEMLGNQEVVIKHLGPQVARLPGLTGMSVLPSGAVVLIYNPVALTTVYAERIRALGAAAVNAAGQVQASMSPNDAVPMLTPSSGSAMPLVMVVDDSITVRRVTQRLLQREGYRVVMAADGQQALDKLEGELPCMVLSDIEMPHMDGFDLTRHIRADARLQHLPLVMITSRIADKHREHALSLGANHYLGKPYRDDELMHLVHHYASQARQQQQVQQALQAVAKAPVA